MPRGLGDDPLSRQRKGAASGRKVVKTGQSTPAGGQSANDVFFKRKPEEGAAEDVKNAAPEESQPPSAAQADNTEAPESTPAGQELPVAVARPAVAPASSAVETEPAETAQPETRRRGFLSRLFGRH